MQSTALNISDPSQLWKTVDGKLENKEKGKSSKKWNLISPNSTLGQYYIEEDTTSLVLQAASGDDVKPTSKSSIPVARQLWRKGNTTVDGYFTLENSEYSRFLTAVDMTTDKFNISGKTSF